MREKETRWPRNWKRGRLSYRKHSEGGRVKRKAAGGGGGGAQVDRCRLGKNVRGSVLMNTIVILGPLLMLSGRFS